MRTGFFCSYLIPLDAVNTQKDPIYTPHSWSNIILLLQKIAIDLSKQTVHGFPA